MRGRELLAGSAFTLTGDPDAKDGAVAFWGRGAYTRFDGKEKALSLDGEVTAAMLGADYARDRWLLGLALVQGWGDGGYNDPGTSSGKLDSTLIAAIPYGAVQATERLKLWGAAGYGQGQVTYEPEESFTEARLGSALKADTGWRLAATGLRGDLPAPSFASGLAWAVVSDGMWVRTNSDRTEELVASEADVTRFRLGLNGSWTIAPGTSGSSSAWGGGALTPRLEAGVRHDGGDAETGLGIELGGGFTWIVPRYGLDIDVRGRTLLSHEADGRKDRGFSGAVAYDPDPASQRGLSFTLRHELGGQASGGLDALFDAESVGERPGSELMPRWTAEAGWGLPAFSGLYTGSPHVGYGLTPNGREYTLGWRLEPASNAPDLSLGIKSTRRDSDHDPTEYRFGLEVRARW